MATVPDVGYRIKGVADHTGDGKADIVWHHATLGDVWFWPMTARPCSARPTWPPSRHQLRIVGTGDYDGNGKADLLWRHATAGDVWVWLMDGAVRLSGTWVSTVSDLGLEVIKDKIMHRRVRVGFTRATSGWPSSFGCARLGARRHGEAARAGVSSA